tara:strand:+ start:1238 stop:1993 length:756 start_codon:yes stop_codon:yes gene_type:complete
MKVNIKEITEIANEKLTMTQRGILITIVLMKDSTPKLTLVKCKASLSFSKHKEDLIYLHDNGLISWSGVTKAKESIDNLEVEKDVIEVIDFVNNLYRRKFSYKTYRGVVLRVLKDYPMEDIKKVISNRYVVWKDEIKMRPFLQPSTLFRIKNFVKYLDEANHTREGESFVNISNLKVEHGEEIVMSLAQNLIDTDTYNLLLYKTDGEGNKRGNSSKIVRYGRDVKKLIKVQDAQEKYNNVREYRYYYNSNI